MNSDGGVDTSAPAHSRRWRILAGWVGLCMAVGIVPDLLFKPGVWYSALEKPIFTLPVWVFAPLWMMLSIAMGVAVWRIWGLPESAARNQALRQFCVQLALNAAWTPVFFGAQSLIGGLVVIVLVAFATVVTIQRFHPLDKIAAWLLAPYLAWVAFGSALNVAMLALNSKF